LLADRKRLCHDVLAILERNTMTSKITYNPQMIEKRMRAIRRQTLAASAAQSHRIRRANRIARALDIAIYAGLGTCAIASLYLIAAGTLPLLGGVAVITALVACAWTNASATHSQKENQRGV
jgi:hypothetical protein